MVVPAARCRLPDSEFIHVIGTIALFLFGMACVYLITTRLEQLELRTREKLLEIELKLQQVADEVRAFI